MYSQGRDDGARVGGSGRSFASGRASESTPAPTSNVQSNEGYGPWADCSVCAPSELASRVLGRSTALIGAAMYSHTLVVEQLIAAGAKLDVQNNKG